MCGIAGYFHPGGAVAASVLARLSEGLAHRGPDGRGFLGWAPGQAPTIDRDPGPASGRPLGLVHRRLAILDASEAGAQPMLSSDGRHAVVFNGEIYNFVELRQELEADGHRFHTRSDTEVLLAVMQRWGAEGLKRLDGMFAFALLDSVAGTLLLARDPFGIKPLYYSTRDGRLCFASELKVLAETGLIRRVADGNAVYDYLAHGRNDHADNTFFADAKALPAAHYAVIDLASPDAIRPVRYWAPDLAAASPLDFAEAAEALRGIFLRSVERHLRSDVPVGAALSGGIDSSAVVMAMRKLQGPDLQLHGFTYVASDARLSEERWSDMVVGASGAAIHKIKVAPGDLITDMDDLIRTQDQPFGSTSIFAQFRVFRTVQEAGIKVTLDGQGADEFLAGYPVFLAARWAGILRQSGVLPGLGFAWEATERGRHGLAGMVLRGAQFILPGPLACGLRSMAGRGAMPGWLDRGWFKARGVEPSVPLPAAEASPLRSQLLDSLTRTSLPALLRYADRNSMRFSVESRVPFLAKEMVEFVFRLPDRFIIDDTGLTKAVFRAAMRGLVPDPVLDRRDKIGFVTPQATWLAQAGEQLEDRLFPKGRAAVSMIRPEEALKLWRSARAGSAGAQAVAWRMVNLAAWSRLFEMDCGEAA